LTATGATSYVWNTGSTANPLSVSPASTTSYTVTGTTSGCSATAVATVTLGGVITITVNSPTICSGSSATLTATGATTYTWNTGSTANPLVVSPTTTTTYTVTGATGACSGTATSTVTVNPVPSMTAPANITACNNTTVAASAYTSTPAGATFAWTNSNTAIGLAASGTGNTPSFTATNATSAPITATITVTPTLTGCTGTPVTYTITVNPTPTVVVPANITTCASTTVAASAFTSPVTGATFAWTNSNTAIGLAASGTGNTPSFTATNATASPITATITVTPTANGCPGTPSTYTITVNPTPTVVVPANITVCNGSAIAGTTFTSPTTGATFAWTNSNTAIGIPASGTGDIASFIGTNTGTAPISATITVTPTANGCPGTPSTYTITVNPTPTVVVPANITVCTSATIAASAFTSPTTGTTYSWTNSNTGIGLAASGTGNTPSFTATNATGSPITSTITVTPSANGCAGTPSTYTITVNSTLIVNAGIDDTICFGGSTTLGVTPNGAGYTYVWAPAGSLSSSTIFNPVASPTTTTNYTVTVTDALGCVGTDNVTVYADPQITTAVAGFNVTCNGACNGQTIVIPGGGSGGFTYNWTSGCTTASCTGLCPGSYSVTVTDSWGCTATADTSITQPTVLTASIAASQPASCNGTCDGSATATGAGGTPGYTYSWSTTPVQTTATATGLCAGSYTCTVTDANSCTTTVTVTITQPTLVVIAPMVNDTICFGGSTTLTASASGGNPGGYNYIWAPAGTGATATVTVNPTTTTVYTVAAADILHNCPATPVTVTVVVNPPLSVNALGSASICPGASTPLTATAVNGNSGPYSYSWSPATGLSATNIANPVASPTVTTTYTVTANDGCSPSDTATVTVTILPLPVVTFNADVLSGCAPLCVNFTDASTVTGGSVTAWDWTFNDAGATANTANPSHCFNTPGAYDITLTTTSNNGCVATVTNTAMINVYPIPVAGFTAPLSSSILNPTVPFTDNSSGATTWLWNFGDAAATPPATNSSTLQNPSHTYSDVGTYCVTQYVYNANGCMDSTVLCVVIDPEFTFYIPNAFSPNGDGINDEFFGKGEYIDTFEMSIYDRWGNLIFFTDDINKHWDGRANHGKEVAQQDVYVYKIDIKDLKGIKHKYIGSVTIVK
jgi:gliding motility-associated-like protein